MKKSLDQILPHFSCMSIPYDPETKKIAMMWRGERVRSAKLCLSTPAGLLEHGESFEESIVRELGEEMGIPASQCMSIRFHDLYRNDNGDGYDWVIGVWSVAVESLADNLRNMEPDKHDALILVPADLVHLEEPTLNDVDLVDVARHIPERLKYASNLHPVLSRIAPLISSL
jgi:8-oxo-dGTP pyrophosphatase MutT (NUDIX family)